MRVIAVILSVYLLGLFIQPGLALLLPKQEQQVMSCCAGHGKHKKDMGNHSGKETKGDCCGGKCNPFYSQCPACSTVAMKSVMTPVLHTPVGRYDKIKFPQVTQQLIGSYLADVLHPPEMIG